MSSSNNRKKIAAVLIFSLIGLAVFLTCVIRAVIVAGKDQASLVQVDREDHAMESWNDGWIVEYADGTQESVSLPCTITAHPGEEIRLTRQLGSEEIPEAMVFDSLREAITVTTDQGPICRVNRTVIAKGMSYTDLQLVRLPETGTISELTLMIRAASDGTCLLPEISCGSVAGACYTILKNDALTLILLCLLLVFVVILVITGAYFAAQKQNDVRLWVLAGFLVLILLWGVTDAYLPAILQIPQEILGEVTYLSLAAMPIPIGAFVWMSYHRESRILPVLMMVTALNLIAQGILSMVGIVQLQGFFWISHLLSMIMVAAALVTVIRRRSTEKADAEQRFLFAASVVQGITSVCTVLIYWLVSGGNYRNTMLGGTLLFIICLFGSVVAHSIQVNREEEMRLSELRISDRLSRVDQLTGMANRRAYEEKLEEIEKAGLKDAIIMMMDVNGLKIVNDTYGHSAGDDLIIAASQVIQSVFQEGFCYRLGGDEFVVILTEWSKEIATYFDELDKAMAERNRETIWKLSLARGASHMVNSAGMRLTISDWKQNADVRMYQHKIKTSGSTNRDRAKDFSDIIDCIVMTVEAKDSYTASHSERVRELSLAIGRMLDLSGDMMLELGTAAHLHDIGKIGVPDRVLFKDGALTDEEYDLMKRHATIGADILYQAKGMKEISRIVLHHHERYDGKGYPDGISGETIPLESRIIAIADSIDAMTSKRVYRNGLSIDECRAEIEKNQGIMYDPEICRTVLEHWNEIQDIILLHPKRLNSGD